MTSLPHRSSGRLLPTGLRTRHARDGAAAWPRLSACLHGFDATADIAPSLLAVQACCEPGRAQGYKMV